MMYNISGSLAGDFAYLVYFPSLNHNIWLILPFYHNCYRIEILILNFYYKNFIKISAVF